MRNVEAMDSSASAVRLCSTPGRQRLLIGGGEVVVALPKTRVRAARGPRAPHVAVEERATATRRREPVQDGSPVHPSAIRSARVPAERARPLAAGPRGTRVGQREAQRTGVVGVERL
jgi:hypothetical protein